MHTANGKYNQKVKVQFIELFKFGYEIMVLKEDIKEEQDINSPSTQRKDNSKIYFFIIAVVALLMTNVYFYVKYKSSGEKLYTIVLQKEKLQIEIDRIEAALDDIQNQSSDIQLPAKLIKDQQEARSMIANLRESLDKSDVTEEQIKMVDVKVVQLKSEVSGLKNELSEVRLQNDILLKQNEKLTTTVSERNVEVRSLKEDNRNLHEKIGVASSVKVSNILINGVEVKRRGNLEIETKARRVDQLQIKFTIADNPLAKEGSKDVYIRIIDPQGNLIAQSDDLFYVHGDKLQYTFKQRINFTNKGEEYEFLWSDDDQKNFKKGAYTVLLYTDNAIMGRSSIVFK